MKILITAALVLIPVAAHAEVSLIEENDSFINGVDRHYTQGLEITQAFAPAPKNDIEDGISNIMLPDGGDTWRYGWFAGQTIYTPEKLWAVTPPRDDRPYAGWLFAGARFYRYDDTVLDKLEVTLGTTGPASLAGDVQTAWHSLGLFGGLKPEGWHGQLRDEPGLILSEQRIWRVTLTDGPLETELLPEANISAGNIFDYAGAGTSFRIGQNLKADWGPPRIAPAQQGSDFQTVDHFAWYIFAGGEARAVARNLFLDGNSFQASPSVAKKSVVGEFNAGAALLFPHARLTASFTHRSAEFRGQRGDDQLGSLTLSFIP